MHVFRYFHSRTTALVLAAALLIPGCTPEAKKARFLHRADAYFKAGEYDKAKIEYLNALRLDPKLAAGYQQIGTIWLEEGDALQALQFLSKARDLSPNNSEARAKLGSALLSFGDALGARKEALAILARAPANEEAIVLLGDVTRTKEEIAATETQLQKFPNHDSSSFQLALAGLLLRKGDQASSEEALKRALSLNPKSSAAHMALAEFSLYKKDLPKAAEEFKTAAELSPPRGIARLKYAEFKLSSGVGDEAKALLKKITQDAPDYFPAWVVQARIAFSEKHYDDALALLKNVLSRDSVNLDAHLLQAQIWLAESEAPKAVETLERLEKSYANLPLLKYHLARAYLQNNNAPQAAVKLNEAIAESPNYTEALLLLGQVNLQAGNPQLVIAPMANILKKRPAFLQAELILAAACTALGRLDDAAAVFREHIKASPNDVQPYFMLGMTLRQKGKSIEAQTAFEKAQELAPDDLVPTYQLVELDILRKDYASAAKRIQAQEERQPKSAGVQFLQGKLSAAQRDWPRAETSLLKALDLDPKMLTAYDLLIAAYLAENKADLAINGLKEALAKNPNNVKSLMLLGVLYDRKHQDTAALETYEKVVALNPNFSPALNNLAYLYSEKQNQLEKAAAFARKARSLQPGDPSIADTLGWILYRQGAYQEALVLLREGAAKLTNPEAQFHVGMANYMMGNSELARDALQRALKSPGKFPGKEGIPPRLAVLGNGSESAPELPVDQLKAMVKQDPGDPLVQIRLGESSEKTGMFQEASAAYERALQVNPKLLPALVKLAQLNAAQLKKASAALDYAKKAKELAPADPKVDGLLGSLQYANHNFPVAYALLQESARHSETDAKIVHDFAWAAYSLGKIDEARDAMKNALKDSPGALISQDATSFLALTAFEEGSKDPAAAKSEVEEMIKSQPNYVPALMGRATIQMRNGNRAAARQTYAEVLGQFPDFAPAQKHLASLYLDDPMDGTKAYDLASKAHRALPNDSEAAQILGKCYFLRKDYRGAVQLLEESVRSAPLNAEGLYYLGMAYRELHENPKSQQTLDRAQTAGLQEPLLNEAKRVLAELRKN